MLKLLLALSLPTLPFSLPLAHLSTMELGSIIEFLENRSILVTGATGFLAKIFAEKIIRVQPNVKKLFLLIRSVDTNAATQRLQHEVIEKELFKVVKEKLSANIGLFLSEKLVAVPGDISRENLGVKDSCLSEEMLKEVEIIVNVAATTDFRERYDVAMRINTLGAMHVLNFAKQCPKIEMLLHVSTAYVCGERGGLIAERPLRMSETLNGTLGLDINAENKLIDDTLHELCSKGVHDEVITLAMKDLGTTRARHYGWPNTYVFTKAMGEMLLGHSKENLPLIVLRPTIITSTFKEPFPGWVEGLRTIDSITAAYCKGKLEHFLCNPTTIVDLMPADMVVNSMIVVMAAARATRQSSYIYHVGSSARNPITYAEFQDYLQRYFIENPWICKDGKPIIVRKVRVFNTLSSFHLHMTIRYLLLLKGLELANILSFQYLKGRYTNLNRKFKLLMRLVDTYKPYLFFEGIFDDMNTERLRAEAGGISMDADTFCFDPKCIDWEDYFCNIHFPGVVRHVFK